MSLTAFVVRIEPLSEERASGDRAVTQYLENLTRQKAFQLDVGAARLQYSSIFSDQNNAAIATETDACDPSVQRTIVFDGWLENRVELIDELRSVGASSKSSDAQLVAKSIRLWGENAINRLYGDYAFVSLWRKGERDEPELFAVRDKVGVRPLFYSASEGKLAVSNLPGALAQIPWVGNTLNEGYAAEFLASEINSVGETLFHRVNRVIGGHSLSVVPRGKPTIARYWTPSSAVSRLSADDATNAFRKCFVNAVSAASTDAHPVGLLLSGGVDSSSIAMVLADLADGGRINARMLSGLSLVFPGQPCDEQPYLDEIEKVIPFSISRRTPEYASAELISAQTKRLNYVAFPFAASSLNVLADSHRELGGRVILNGEGGDELLLPYAKALRGALYRPKDWSALQTYLTTRANNLPSGFSRRGRLRQLVSPLLGWTIENAANRWRDRRRSGWVSPVDEGWSARTRLIGRLDRLAPPAFARTVSVALSSSGFWSETNENAFFHSLLRAQEARSPFLSARLLEFCNTLPLALLDGQTAYSRQLLRTSVRHRLPSPIANRRGKSEFSGALLPALELAALNRFGANWSHPGLSSAGSSTLAHSDSPQVWRLDAAQSFAAFSSHCL